MEIIQQITSSALGIAAAVIILGLCVLFHETGHFLVAKLTGMKVEHFAIGMGPALWKRRRGDTEYGICMFPIGGSVKIAGMEPGEADVEGGFHSRPRYLGALVIVAGVFMNLVLALLLYGIVAYAGGVGREGAPGTVIAKAFPSTPAAHSGLQPGDQIVAVDGNRRGLAVRQVSPDSPAAKLGLRLGDRVLQVGDKLASAPTDLVELLRGQPGQQIRVAVSNPTAPSLEEAVRWVQFPALSDLAAGELSPAAAEQTLRERLGLDFLDLDQADVINYTSLRPNRDVAFTVLRQGAEQTYSLRPEPDSARILKISKTGQITTPHATIGRIGVVLSVPTDPISPLQALQVGAADCVNSVVVIVEFLRGMIGGQVAAAPGGPLSILAMTYEQSRLGWHAVARFGGFLSTNLAIFNLLPIPPLDGFILLSLGYEAIVRRRMNPRAESLVKIMGFTLLMALLIGLTFNDLKNLIVHGTP